MSLEKIAPFIIRLYQKKMEKNMLKNHQQDIQLFNNYMHNKPQQKPLYIKKLIDLNYLTNLPIQEQDDNDDSQSIDPFTIKQNKASNKDNYEPQQEREDEKEEEEGDIQNLEDYDDAVEDELIYENQELDGDTTQEDEQRNNIEEGKNFAKTCTPTQMLQQFQLKEYQQQGLTWMLHREQKIKKTELYDKKDFLINKSDGTQADFSQAYIQYEIQNADGIEKFYFNPLNGHSCYNIEIKEERNPIHGGILADQMGLGKTIMTISLILQSKYKDYLQGDYDKRVNNLNEQMNDLNNNNNTSRYAHNNIFRKFHDNIKKSQQQKTQNDNAAPLLVSNNSSATLIVVPKSLVRQWEKEIKSTLKQDSLLSIHLYEKAVTYSEAKVIFKNKDIVITTYGILANEYKNLKKNKVTNGYLMKENWERVILDEAHIIRNRNTLISQSCCQLKANFRWCLTGTPLQNKMDDLYSYFKFLKVPQVGDWKWWKNFISQNKEKDNAYEFIRVILKGIMLRRTKTTKDEQGKLILVLPKKQIITELIQFNSFEGQLYSVYFNNQKSLFEKILKDYQKNGQQNGDLREQIFTIINSLRMMCNNFQMIKIFKESSLTNLRKIIKQLKSEAAAEGDEDDDDDDDDDDENDEEDLNNKNISWKQFYRIPIINIYPPIFDYLFHLELLNELLFYLLNNNKLRKQMRKALNRKDDRVKKLIKWTGLSEQNRNEEKENSRDNDYDEDSEDEESYKKLAKTERVIEIIEMIRKRNEKVVLFTQWHDSINRLKNIFKDKKIQFTELHGKMPISERAQQIKDFSQNQSKTVMILSLMAGCVGLNLTIANNVIMMDPWWNSSIEEQAIDRIYRIGQKKDINVYRCLINEKNSIDLKINQLHLKKQQIFNNILSTSSDERIISQNLTMDDYKFIFGVPSLPQSTTNQDELQNIKQLSSSEIDGLTYKPSKKNKDNSTNKSINNNSEINKNNQSNVNKTVLQIQNNNQQIQKSESQLQDLKLKALIEKYYISPAAIKIGMDQQNNDKIEAQNKVELIENRNQQMVQECRNDEEDDERLYQFLGKSSYKKKPFKNSHPIRLKLSNNNILEPKESLQKQNANHEIHFDQYLYQNFNKIMKKES